MTLRFLTIWQPMPSPHMLPLAAAFARHFEHVRFVTLGGLDPQRQAIGWRTGEAEDVEQIHAPTKAERQKVLMMTSSSADLHLLPGIKPAPWLRAVSKFVRGGPATVAIMCEAPRGEGGRLRRLVAEMRDRALVHLWKDRVIRVFATGTEAVAYYRRIGFADGQVVPFGYFPELCLGEGGGIVPIPPIIAVAGKLEPYKGIDLLIRALALLKEREWRVRVAGDGPQRSKLLASAANHGIADRFEWLGWLQQAEIGAFLRAASLLVLPSRYDGWGAVANEALGVGTPVVASDGAGSHCLLVCPDLGESFQSGDILGIAAAIARQLELPLSQERRCAICGWASKALSPLTAADYFVEALNGRNSVPPWQAMSFGAPR